MRSRALVVLLGVVLLLLPFNTLIELSTDEGPFRYLGTAADLPMVLLALVVTSRIPDVRRAAWRPLAVAAAILALLAAAFVVNPSPLGSILVARYASALVIALGVGLIAPGERTLVIVLLVATTAVEMAIAAAQIATRAPLGLPGELQDELLLRGASIAPRGTLSHPYVLASMGLIAAGASIAPSLTSSRWRAWLIAVATAVSPVGITYSRTALIGVVAACASLAPNAQRKSRPHILAILALAIGVLVPAVIEPGGWLWRAEMSLERPPDRPLLIAQAFRVIADAPLLGVGPGRYLVALDERERRDPDSVKIKQVPHSVPVLLAADAGAGTGILAVVLLAWLGWRSVRAGAAATALYVLFVPFVLNDHFVYTTAQGAAAFGAWMGLIVSHPHRSR